MKPAILPDQLVKSGPRHLEDINPGETVFTAFTALVVKADRTCFLSVQSEVSEKDAQAISVTKESDGSFTVVVPPDRQYKTGGNPLAEKYGRLVPVSTLKVSS